MPPPGSGGNLLCVWKLHGRKGTHVNQKYHDSWDYYNYQSGFKAMCPHNAKCLTWNILLKHIKQYHWVCIIINPILQMRKQRLKEVN